jgi:tripartite-type tricarboxylate transporter receptor subunit TctC
MARPKHLQLFAAIATIAAAVSAPPASGAAADSTAWPERPVTIIVPIAAGGGTDLIARAVASELQEAWKQPVIIKNQAGANGTVGTVMAARAPADGYTLLVGTQGTFAANTCLYKLPYAATDFTPAALFAQFNSIFVVRADSPIQSLSDLVKRAKAAPGKLTYGITVVGSSAHLGVEMFKSIAAINVLGIPYNGGPPATVDLLGGRLDFLLDAINSQYGNVAAGKMRALASTSLTRSTALPNVPTVAEQGYPGFDAVGWAGFYVPAGTPKPIIDKIARTVTAVFATGKLQSKLGNKGFEFFTTNPRSFAAYDKSERAKWCGVIKQANIKLD